MSFYYLPCYHFRPAYGLSYSKAFTPRSIPLMKSSFLKVTALLAVGSTVLLTACGGGSAGNAPTTPSTQASTVTVANSSDVAAQSYSASNALSDQINGSSSLVTGVSVETQTTGLIDASIQHLYRALQVQPVNMVTGVTGTLPAEPCTGGGTIAVSYNVANTSTVSNGDTVNITASNCVEDQMSINGGLNIVFSSLTGTPSSTSTWGATMKMTFTNFAVTESGMASTATGDLTLGYNQTSTGTVGYTASGNSLQLNATKGGSTVARTISAYSYSGSTTASNLHTYRANFTVTGNLPRLGNNISYVVKTITDFKQQGTGNPSEGVLTVTASDKTSLTFTVLSTSNVQIGIDKDGDGKVDDTVTKTWTELLSLL
jgi:hypothetical protein